MENLLPDDKGLLVVLETYFDESVRDSGTFAVAGYGLFPEQAINFSRDWREMLGPIKAFHMADLVALRGEFKGFTGRDRDALLRRAVELVNRDIAVAFAVSCNRTEFASIAVSLRGLREPYSYLCMLCMQTVGNWMRATDIDGDVAYVFESGQEFQEEACDLMNLATKFKEIGELYRYRSHTFAAKCDAAPLQAADLLAWEWTKHHDETVAQPIRPTRASLLALYDQQKYRVRHLAGETLRMVYEEMRQISQLEGIETDWLKILRRRS